MFRGLLLGLLLALSLAQVEATPIIISHDAWDAIKYFPESEHGTALRVFYCESHWDKYQVGQGGERAIPQIHPIHFNKYDVTGGQLADNPPLAGIVAYQIWLESGWTAWSCY